MAKTLLLKRSPKHSRNRMSNLEVLLKDSHLTYYWIGFILADGNLSNNKRLSISLSIKDKQHILKLAKYLKCTSIIEGFGSFKKNGTKTKFIKISAQNPEVVSQLCKKFDIKGNKTEYPPKVSSLKKLNNKLLLSLIIGFIDGDGCIVKGKNRNSPLLTVKNHKSWLKNLSLFKKHIYSILKIIPMHLTSIKAHINNSGYAVISISDSAVLVNLKKFAVKNNLPILKRKWNRVSDTYKNRYFNIRKI